MPQSVMEHSFSRAPSVEIPRSRFNRSHGYKTTFDADYLIPVLVDDVVPGDSVNCRMHFFARLASPTLFPLMDNLQLESHFFFVPYRLIWTNFPKFHGAQDNPADSIDYTIPKCDGASSTVGVNDLAHYFGIPFGVDIDAQPVTALPFRAYRLIWNEWYRDQNLQDSVTVAVDDGPDSNGESGYYDSPLKRGKRHDYFTSCLPSPQKGDAVALPLSGNAPVMGIGTTATGYTSTATNVREGGGNQETWTTSAQATTAAWFMEEDPSNAGYPNIYADLSGLVGSTIDINDLRLAIQTQRLLERDARSGTRINEVILAHFGVRVPDYRVQRPEYLGGGSTPINISPVAQTTYQGTQTLEDAKGALSGIGTVDGTHSFTKSFDEWGVIIGLVSVRGDITYSQGIERYWTKSTRYDTYYPALSQIGEQAVRNDEIYWNAADPDGVFGYQERYAEYRYKPSRLTGLMAVDATGSLSSWHLSEDFATEPALDSTFIESNTGGPLDRAVAVPSEPHFIFDAFFDYRWARPMPLWGIPGNMDRL